MISSVTGGSSIDSTSRVPEDGVVDSKSEVQKRLETSIENLKEKLEKKANTKRVYGNYFNAMRNRIVNIVFSRRKKSMSGILKKIESFYEGNGSRLKEDLFGVKFDLSLDELKGIKHSSVYKDVKGILLEKEKQKLQDLSSKADFGKNFEAINELLDLMSGAYFVLDVCRFTIDRELEMVFASNYSSETGKKNLFSQLFNSITKTTS